uniref:Bromodomain adjacent to zinc finger domain, 2Ba n=1 Tax=Neogobius melanostomus TaxID=47308 RepID=A0A8C6STP3_9GOBI
EQPFIGSTLSSAFPLVNHPAFGALYTAGAGRPEFGGLGSLGSLGMSAALATHPQLGALSEWWRAAEAHGRGAAAFLPSFIGFPPFFAPHLTPNHSASPLPMRMPSKNSHSPPKGTAIQLRKQKHLHTLSCQTLWLKAHNRTLMSKKGCLLSIQKARKKPADGSTASHSESGSSSDSSSDGSLSSDLEDLQEDDDDDDDEEDEEDEDKSSELLDSDKRLPPSLLLNFPLFNAIFLLFSQTLGSHGQLFPPELKKQTGPKSPKRTSLSPLPPVPAPQNNHSNLFLSSALLGLPEPHHPNGVIQSTTQDAPLALITKPRKDSAPRGKSPQCDSDSGSMPVNLSTGASRTQSQPPLPHPMPQAMGPERARAFWVRAMAWEFFRCSSYCSQSTQPFYHLSFVSESDSNSDSDISGKKSKDLKLQSGLSKKESSSRRLTKGAELLNTSTNHTATSCSPLNLQVIKSPAIVSSSSALAYHSSPGSSYSLASPLGNALNTENKLWRRETRIKSVAGRPQGEVAYYGPCGKKLRQYPDVMKGLQWSLLKEDEVIPRILAMEGRRGRPSGSERQLGLDGAKGQRRRKGRPPNVGDPLVPEGPSPSEVKLLRKLEAQEIARQAAQMKLMRKLEKQALARAAKEARKQQAIMAAEERRKQKEQIKILKQQEKIKRIQQIRMEKELRAQQILEAKRRKKEEAANAKILEAEKRIKVSVNSTNPLNLFVERERRRQHVMLMKAVEARKKAEERERLRQEKRDEKRLNKERKLEQRRLEQELARELKKPNEDMCLSDHKPLPEFSRIPGLILPGRAVSDCLMLMQFLRGFGKVLGLDLNSDVPTLSMLQEGLLNVGDSMGQVQDLLVKLLSLAVCDPGLPPGQKTKTMLGDHLTNVGINRDNVSEVLQMYMVAHCANTELAPLALSLKTKAFQAHTPEQKASILGFLANELACSKAVIRWAICCSNVVTPLPRLRIIYAKRTGKREGGVGVEETQSVGTPSSATKRKRKMADSDDDEDEDDDSDDPPDDDDEDEEEEIKKVKKTEAYDEVRGPVLYLSTQHHQIRRKLFEISHSLRSMMYGQDRYRRRYWVLPHCGGVFIEGMESGEAAEELEEERQRRKRAAEEVKVKDEPQEIEVQKDKLTDSDTQREEASEDKTHSLYYQQPGSISKVCFPRDSNNHVGTDSVKEEDKESVHQNGSPVGHLAATVTPTTPTHNSSEPSVAETPSVTKSDAMNTSPPSSARDAYESTLPQTSSSPSLQLQFQTNDQLLRVLTERSGHWFSLLPRSPCDMSSLASPLPGASRVSPQASSTPVRPKSPPPSPALPLTPIVLSLVSTGSFSHFIHLYPALSLQIKPGASLLGLSFGSWSSGLLSPGLPLCTSPMPAHSLENTTAASVSSKSESPVPRVEKLSSIPSPALELPKSPDHPAARPIPEEMLTGWWRVSNMEELKALVEALHTRGSREKGLQRQIQKYMEIIPQVCTKHRDVAMIELHELEESQVSEESVWGWCVEEQAMEMDIAVLQQVEELERKVTAASLQVKGWMHPDPQSEREDLVYYEHKPLTKPSPTSGREKGGVVRHPDNPLDIAVTRLAELERNIERSGEEEVAHGMKVWRKALTEVRSAAQLAMCIQQLQKSIAWERSIMKVYCQICKKGDNEDLLLLCDGCDKGCHTYCHKPKITSIPEGDWYCPACISKASSPTPKNKKPQSKLVASTAGSKKAEAKKNGKQTGNNEVSEEDAASANSTPKKGAKDNSRKRKTEESTPVPPAANQESPACVKRAKTARDNNRDLGLCSIKVFSTRNLHQDAWPFLTPVNLKSVPGYKKVIKKPMDFSTIREKLVSSQYQNLETFIIDVNLVFDNCEKFNEDNSDIGRAGHNMRKFFEKRWTELLKQTN